MTIEMRHALASICLLAAQAALANTTDNDALAAKYPTYASTYGCGACHTTAPALNVYGNAYKLAVVARGGRSPTNDPLALADIEPLDSDGDSYSNIVEINANKPAWDPSQSPGPSVSLLANPAAKSGDPTQTVSYSVTVTNNGGLTDSFALAATVASGQPWAPSIVGTANNVGPGAQVTVQVNVTIPGSATQGQTSAASFTATSQLNTAVVGQQALTTSLIVRGARFVDAIGGTDASDCTSAACRTITYAMSQAQASNSLESGDTINVAPGVYNAALGEVFPIVMKDGVQLVSLNGPNQTTIDATGASQRIMNACCSGRIEGFTFTGGLSAPAFGSFDQANGGAVNVSGTSGPFVITRNIFRDNAATGQVGGPTDNISQGGDAAGGAIFFNGAAILTGGVFYNWPMISNNAFVGNNARGGKGRSSASDGAAGGHALGGAVYGTRGTVVLNTFYENFAIGGPGGDGGTLPGGPGGDAAGGAVSSDTFANGASVVEGNIFSGNEALGGAGGAGASAGAAGNAAAGALQVPAGSAVAYNLHHDNVPGGEAFVSDIVGLDPLFHAPALDDFRIRRTSPAHGALPGFTAPVPNAPAMDLDTRPRPTPASIGAYEAALFPGDITDLNRDRKSDLVWRNETDGRVYRFTMNGFTILDQALAYVESNTAWKIVGDADFNGDGFSDLLWRNSTTGQVYILFMGAGGLPMGGGFIYTEPNPSWKIVQTPDIDGDGKADILWWNSSTGQVYALLMNGLTIKQQGFVYTEPNTDWRIEAAGEFSYSGKSNEVVWRNVTTGDVWLMTISVSAGGFSQSGRMIYSEPNTAWHIVGVADLDGDGRGDLVWRNDITGMIYGQLMNTANDFPFRGEGVIYTEPNLDWKVVALGDYNGDGKADLLWRNETTGEVYMMLMNGLAIANQQMIYAEPNTDWKILGPYEYAK
jgi:hypothetical protein